jgi:hypothetical protein
VRLFAFLCGGFQEARFQKQSVFWRHPHLLSVSLFVDRGPLIELQERRE